MLYLSLSQPLSLCVWGGGTAVYHCCANSWVWLKSVPTAPSHSADHTQYANHYKFSLDFDSQEQFLKAHCVWSSTVWQFVFPQIFPNSPVSADWAWAESGPWSLVVICGVCDMGCMTCTYIRRSSCTLVIDWGALSPLIALLTELKGFSG